MGPLAIHRARPCTSLHSRRPEPRVGRPGRGGWGVEVMSVSAQSVKHPGPRAIKKERPAAGDPPVDVNEVRLVGRLAAAPEQRTLPSGDVVWTFRVVVGRAPDPTRPRSTVDSLECAVWKGRLRRSLPGWLPGDVVEVEGAMRRRFFRAGGSPASRVEVEVSGGRLVRRAATG